MIKVLNYKNNKFQNIDLDEMIIPKKSNKSNLKEITVDDISNSNIELWIRDAEDNEEITKALLNKICSDTMYISLALVNAGFSTIDKGNLYCATLNIKGKSFNVFTFVPLGFSVIIPFNVYNKFINDVDNYTNTSLYKFKEYIENKSKWSNIKSLADNYIKIVSNKAILGYILFNILQVRA